MGPLEIRKYLYKTAAFKKWIKSRVLVDAGDIFVVPQLLEDDILTSKQISKNRAALYKGKKLTVSDEYDFNGKN